MKIMYLLFSFTVGGTERLLVDICNEMSQSNDVYLYIVNKFYDKNMLDSLSKKVDVVLKEREPGSYNKISAIFELSMFVKNNRIDVIHCNALNTPDLLLLKKIMFNNVKIIYTIHGINQYNHLNRIQVWYRNQICQTIIAISTAVKNDIIAAGADVKKVRTVYNAINLKRFVYKKNIHMPKDKMILGSVARIDLEKKAQDLLMSAILELKKNNIPVKCYFAGAADEMHKKDFCLLEQFIKENGLEEDIVLLGNIDDISSFLQTIDIFILPSRCEGFGISLVEAMATGIPCISSDIDGPKEIIGENQRGLLFQSGDHIDLARAIKDVIRNYSSYLQTAKCASKYVKKNFNIETMCENLIEIYNNSASYSHEKLK